VFGEKRAANPAKEKGEFVIPWDNIIPGTGKEGKRIVPRRRDGEKKMGEGKRKKAAYSGFWGSREKIQRENLFRGGDERSEKRGGEDHR